MDKSLNDILNGIVTDRIFVSKEKYVSFLADELTKKLIATGYTIEKDVRKEWSAHKIDINITNGQDSYSIFVHYKANNLHSHF